jgi:PBP1b-binding outer membrane lipoprotein LpoB
MKNQKIIKVGAIAALAAAAAFSLSACSNAANEESNSSEESNQVVAPTIIDVATADGQTTDPADWSAVLSDPAVASFTAGGMSGDAVMNPGLQGTAAGTTTVELTNKTTGKVVTFTVNVK